MFLACMQGSVVCLCATWLASLVIWRVFAHGFVVGWDWMWFFST